MSENNNKKKLESNTAKPQPHLSQFPKKQKLKNFETNSFRNSKEHIKPKKMKNEVHTYRIGQDEDLEVSGATLEETELVGTCTDLEKDYYRLTRVLCFFFCCILSL